MLLDCRCCTPCSDAVDCLYYGSPYFIQPHQEQIVSNTVPTSINPKQWSRILKRQQTLASSPDPNRRSRRFPVRARAKRSTSARSENNASTRQKLQDHKSGKHDAVDTRRMDVANVMEIKHDIALASDEDKRSGNQASH